MKYIVIIVTCVYIFAHILMFSIADSAIEAWPIGYFSLLSLFFIADFAILKIFNNNKNNNKK